MATISWIIAILLFSTATRQPDRNLDNRKEKIPIVEEAIPPYPDGPAAPINGDPDKRFSKSEMSCH